MLSDIKNQNQYLLDKNADLEYIIERDLKPKIEDGFFDLKQDIKSLKKTIKNQDS